MESVKGGKRGKKAFLWKGSKKDSWDDEIILYFDYSDGYTNIYTW